MLRALSAGERGVLLAHERAHAQSSHYIFTSAARLAAAANPLLRPVAVQAGYTVERWADERAAAQVGDRTFTARAIARAALATSAAPPDRQAAMTALGLITQEGRVPQDDKRPTSLRNAGPVPRRIAALLAPPPRLPGVAPLLAAAIVLVALSAASALEAARDFHQLIELAQGQPA